MGTVSFPSVNTSAIETLSGSLSINDATFPLSDSTPRATATFGDTESFISRSTRQEVTTSTSTIAIGISIVGVNFNGPVTLTFEDGEVNLQDIYIVDEGGFCSATNTITATSASAVGSLVVANPYSYMRARTNGTTWFAEVTTTVVNPDGSTVTENEDGSETVISPDGTSVNTSVDGLTTFTVNPDGSTVAAVESTNGNTVNSTTILPDGTEIIAEVQSNGSSSSFTTLPDGTTIDGEESTSGNTVYVTTSPDGTVQTEVDKANGTETVTTVSPDGSTYSFELKSNGRVTIETVDASSGVTVTEVYVPSNSYYTQTTTPPGTSVQLSPNPYAV